MPCATLNTPLGILRICADNVGLLRITFSSKNELLLTGDHPLLCKAKEQLSEYFVGQRRLFELPLSPQGTVFQQAVWAAIRRIPYGTTASYGELAAELGHLNKARAVGGAAGKNPLPIVIPCHRVIGGSGQLVGFSAGLAIKQRLLDLERRNADHAV